MNIRDYKVGDIVTENEYGSYKITRDLRYDGFPKYVEVLFLEPNKFGIPNVTVKARLNNIRNGCGVVNPYFPTFCGVGAKGIVDNKSIEYIKLRSVWEHFMKACYKENDPHYKYYAGNGITVTLRWQCLEFFIEDAKYLQNYNEWLTSDSQEYVFDFKKDAGYTVIGPDSCWFAPISYNKVKKALVQNINNGTYMGIRKRYDNCESYDVTLQKKFFGTFDSPVYAGMYYNHLASLVGYPPEALNPIPQEYQNTTLTEIRQHQCDQVKRNSRYRLYTILNEDPNYDAKFLKKLEENM